MIEKTHTPTIGAAGPWPSETMPDNLPAASLELRAAFAGDCAGIERLLVALTAAEVGRQRRRPVAPGEWSTWTAETPIDEDGIGLDSLARLQLVARVERFFQLHRSGAEDHLVVRTRIGEWVEVVQAGLDALPADDPLPLGFETSGSTGTPRLHIHGLADLGAEVERHADLLAGSRRIVSLVPPHHIYGFLWTVLGPRIQGLPSLDLRARDPGAVPSMCRAGDAVIATPFHWQATLAAGADFPPGVTAVLSGGPSDAPLWQALAERGLSRSVEVYGSTETAGIAWREAPDAPFTLLPHIVADAADPPMLLHAPGRPMVAVPDHLVWTGPRSFRIEGRRDGAIAIGGVNVQPARVRARLAEAAGVAACGVRPATLGGSERLHAFVVPAEPAILSDADRLVAFENRLRTHCSEHLSPPERPASFRFGPRLPVNEMGKPTDWLGT